MKKIILLLLICVGLVVAGCAKAPTAKKTPTPVATTPPKPVTTPVKTPKPVTTPTKKLQQNVTKTAPVKQTINCELCHTKAMDYKPHVEGGKYCLKCHGKPGMTVAEVAHSVHKGVIGCEVCHGKAPNLTIPKPMYPGQSVCVNCHNPKNPTKPCTNLVEIHHGHCEFCHTQPINVIHKAADENYIGK